jgi:hypothetical protein
LKKSLISNLWSPILKEVAQMPNSQTHSIAQLTWQSLLWRLLLTLLVLLALAGPGLTLFERAISHTGAPALPTMNALVEDDPGTWNIEK